MARPVGIDLGTTYSVAAIIENGRAKVIKNAEGENLTPSGECDIPFFSIPNGMARFRFQPKLLGISIDHAGKSNF